MGSSNSISHAVVDPLLSDSYGSVDYYSRAFATKSSKKSSSSKTSSSTTKSTDTTSKTPADSSGTTTTPPADTSTPTPTPPPTPPPSDGGGGITAMLQSWYNQICCPSAPPTPPVDTSTPPVTTTPTPAATASTAKCVCDSTAATKYCGKTCTCSKCYFQEGSTTACNPTSAEDDASVANGACPNKSAGAKGKGTDITAKTSGGATFSPTGACTPLPGGGCQEEVTKQPVYTPACPPGNTNCMPLGKMARTIPWPSSIGGMGGHSSALYSHAFASKSSSSKTDSSKTSKTDTSKTPDSSTTTPADSSTTTPPADTSTTTTTTSPTTPAPDTSTTAGSCNSIPVICGSVQTFGIALVIILALVIYLLMKMK